MVGLICRIKSVLITAMFNIGTGDAIPVVAPKGTGGGSGVTGIGTVKKWALTRMSLILLQRRYATNGRFLKTFLQRSVEYSTLECL